MSGISFLFFVGLYMYYNARTRRKSLIPSTPPMRRARTRYSHSRVTLICLWRGVTHSSGAHGGGTWIAAVYPVAQPVFGTAKRKGPPSMRKGATQLLASQRKGASQSFCRPNSEMALTRGRQLVLFCALSAARHCRPNHATK